MKKRIRCFSAAALTGVLAVALTACFTGFRAKEDSRVAADSKEHTGSVETVETSSHALPASWTEEEKLVYEEVLASLLAMDGETFVSTKDEEVLKEAFTAVMNEHPEIFYADGYEFKKYMLDEKLEKLSFSGKFTLEPQRVEELKPLIEEAAAGWMKEMPADSEYAKVKYLYETLIQKTEYKKDAPMNQTIASVFLYGQSVCQGYARAMQYLLQKAGMECMLAAGSVNGEGHAWDVVKVDGKWYHVDPTWGDASYLFDGEGEPESARPAVNYDYLCVTGEQLKKTHAIRDEEKLPVCNSTEASYYEREGLCFGEPDEEKLQSLFERALQEKWPSVTFKCTNEETWDWMRGLLLEEQKVFEYLPEQKGSIPYYDSGEQRTLGFWLQ